MQIAPTCEHDISPGHVKSVRSPRQISGNSESQFSGEGHARRQANVAVVPDREGLTRVNRNCILSRQVGLFDLCCHRPSLSHGRPKVDSEKTVRSGMCGVAAMAAGKLEYETIGSRERQESALGADLRRRRLFGFRNTRYAACCSLGGSSPTNVEDHHGFSGSTRPGAVRVELLKAARTRRCR